MQLEETGMLFTIMVKLIADKMVAQRKFRNLNHIHAFVVNIL